MNKYIPIIGLEVHVELKTKSKMFCGCSADYFGKQPNTHTCPVCLGLPGALPVPNKTAIDWCIKIALALNCKINELSKFDRKNYFYPDLAKGYQISQYDLPFGHDGYINLGENNSTSHEPKSNRHIRIRRVHMEEDTGKLTHVGNTSLVDFNRGGVPLVEIVTEPDFHDPADVKEYLQKLQQIVRYLNVSNADMEKGDMRLEPNISLSLRGGTTKQSHIQRDRHAPIVACDDTKFELPNYKVEVKNINSFRFVEKAIKYEIERQAKILDKGETPKQETRGWNDARQETFSQRSKEEAQDYRYFPEPDIPPIKIIKSQISDLKSDMPELPDAKLARFIADYNLSAYDAEILTREKQLADYFEKVINIVSGKRGTSASRTKILDKPETNNTVTPKQLANWIINKKIDPNKVTPKELLNQIKSATQMVVVDEEELRKLIAEVLQENEKAVAEYKNGKENAIMFLLGQVMRKIGKKVDVQQIKIFLKEQINGETTD